MFYPAVQTNHCGYLCHNEMVNIHCGFHPEVQTQDKERITASTCRHEMVNTVLISSRSTDTRQRTNHCQYL